MCSHVLTRDEHMRAHDTLHFISLQLKGGTNTAKFAPRRTPPSLQDRRHAGAQTTAWRIGNIVVLVWFCRTKKLKSYWQRKKILTNFWAIQTAHKHDQTEPNNLQAIDSRRSKTMSARKPKKVRTKWGEKRDTKTRCKNGNSGEFLKFEPQSNKAK